MPRLVTIENWGTPAICIVVSSLGPLRVEAEVQEDLHVTVCLGSLTV